MHGSQQKLYTTGESNTTFGNFHNSMYQTHKESSMSEFCPPKPPAEHSSRPTISHAYRNPTDQQLFSFEMGHSEENSGNSALFLPSNQVNMGYPRIWNSELDESLDNKARITQDYTHVQRDHPGLK